MWWTSRWSPAVSRRASDRGAETGVPEPGQRLLSRGQGAGCARCSRQVRVCTRQQNPSLGASRWPLVSCPGTVPGHRGTLSSSSHDGQVSRALHVEGNPAER